MADHIRAKLEALISDSGMFNAGQQEERHRLQLLIDCRIDELRAAPSPLTLKQQALRALQRCALDVHSEADLATLEKALEALPDD